MKIKVIFTGGTIGSRTNGGTVGLSRPPYKLLEHEKYDGIDFETAEPYSILSEELSGGNLLDLLKCVRENTADCHGIIITHGTDTLAYTSAFLALALSDVKMPIVLVSSGFPLDDKRANGYENFSAAVTFIKSGISGVYTVWSSDGLPRIHHAARVLAPQPYSDYVESIFGEDFGHIENGVFLKNPDFAAKPCTNLFAEANPDNLNGLRQVLCLTACPEMCYPTPNECMRAVLIQTYHSGTLCADERFADFVGQCGQHGIEIFLVGTGGRETEYESTQKYRVLGVTALNPIAPTAAYMKLGLAISCGYDLQNIMKQNCGGEE